MDQSSHERNRKRRRKIWACSECRRRKLQCDRVHPICGRCREAGQASECRYVDVPSAVASASAQCTSPIEISSSSYSAGEMALQLIQLETRLKLLESSNATDRTPLEDPALTEPLITSGLVRNGYPPLYSYDGDHKPGVLRGDTFRTKFHGGTFSGTLAQQIPGLGSFTRDAFAAFPVLEEIQQGVSQTQQAAASADLSRERASLSALLDLLPVKEVTDSFLAEYMNGFDHVYHVIHHPTFDLDYAKLWLDPSSSDPRYVVLVLLVVAIAYYSTAQQEDYYINDERPARDKATVIIEMCERWLHGRIQKYDCILDFQVNFLLLVGRQLRARWYKRTWVSAGNTLRIWMCAGLHRSLQTGSTVIMKEMRSRLWAAAAEFELQASFEHGMCGLCWPQQSDIGPPLNVPDHVLDLDAKPEQVKQHTPTSFLSNAGRSLRFRHRLNNVLNDMTQVTTFGQIKTYTDEIHNFVQTIPSSNDSPSAAVQALLSINLHQYLLALHTRQLQQPASSVEKMFSRVALVDAAFKMVECHKTAIDNGSQIVEALYGDHVRIALSVCFACLTADPQADCVITAVIEDRSLGLIADAIALAGEKVKHLNTDRYNFWLTVATKGLIQSRKNPERRALYLQESVTHFSQPYGDLLNKLRIQPSLSSGAEVTTNSRYIDDTAVFTQDEVDLSVDEWFYQWCNNASSEAWPSGWNGFDRM